MNSSMPISHAQNEQLGTREKLNVIVKHLNQTVNDTTTMNEPVKPSFVVVDREKTLEMELSNVQQTVKVLNNTIAILQQELIAQKSITEQIDAKNTLLTYSGYGIAIITFLLGIFASHLLGESLIKKVLQAFDMDRLISGAKGAQLQYKEGKVVGKFSMDLETSDESKKKDDLSKGVKL